MPVSLFFSALDSKTRGWRGMWGVDKEKIYGKLFTVDSLLLTVYFD